MLKRLLTIIGILLILGLTPSPFGTIFGVNEYTIGKIINGTNKGSYINGYWQGSLTGPQHEPRSNWYPEHDSNTCASGGSQILGYPPKVNGTVIPAVTNTTACEDGWFNGWKNWCSNHAIDCVGNITLGYFPDMMLKAHEQYNMGYNAANGSGNLCPIGENAAFCTGWYNNNGEDHECGESSYSGPFSFHTLIGCPLDTINSNQMAKPHALIGTWDYVNGTISGKIVYSDYGNFTLTVPTKNAFGDYKLGGSWGSLGPNIVTQCYRVGACENNTLTTITPNHVEFLDNRGDTIHLMRDVGGMSNNLNESHMIGPNGNMNATQNGINATITAPQGSTINNAIVNVFQPRFLSGTWNFVNGFGNVSGVITFGNQDLCPNCKWNWQHDASFSGIFSGNPVSGTYSWETAPSPPSVYKIAPPSSLSLMYQYHHKDVIINGNLNFINPAHMELTDINHWKSGESVVGSDYTVATGLHLHYGDIIHLIRGGTALKILPPAIAHAPQPDLSIGKCPHSMYLDKTLGLYHCHSAGKTHGLAPANMTNQWYRAW